MKIITNNIKLFFTFDFDNDVKNDDVNDFNNVKL